MGVRMVAQAARGGGSEAQPVSFYDFEYELDSTRGRKRVLDTVTIAARRLYIVNATLSCGKEACDAGAEARAALLRRVVKSLEVASG